jgi:hypothetical protein
VGSQRLDAREQLGDAGPPLVLGLGVEAGDDVTDGLEADREVAFRGLGRGGSPAGEGRFDVAGVGNVAITREPAGGATQDSERLMDGRSSHGGILSGSERR